MITGKYLSYMCSAISNVARGEPGDSHPYYTFVLRGKDARRIGQSLKNEDLFYSFLVSAVRSCLRVGEDADLRVYRPPVERLQGASKSYTK